ncbi:MAG: transposase [Candidatus Thiodiazotropha taylori]|nr:transposase [Candidatus Thiodiazotropha taylori]
MGLTRKKYYDRYTLEFKKIVVKLANHPGVMAKDVAETLGLHPVMVYRWQMEGRRGELRGNPYVTRQVQNGRSPAGSRKSEKEKIAEQKLKQAEKRIKKLERELANREDEIQLLKKAERFFTKIK